MDLVVAEVLEVVEALVVEELGVADAALVAPPLVAGDPSNGAFAVGLTADGVRDGVGHEVLVILLENLSGELG